ncbi:unnamed protein product, partial [Discosporangium mesarthrocarpum]
MGGREEDSDQGWRERAEAGKKEAGEQSVGKQEAIWRMGTEKCVTVVPARGHSANTNGHRQAQAWEWGRYHDTRDQSRDRGNSTPTYGLQSDRSASDGDKAVATDAVGGRRRSNSWGE